MSLQSVSYEFLSTLVGTGNRASKANITKIIRTIFRGSDDMSQDLEGYVGVALRSFLEQAIVVDKLELRAIAPGFLDKCIESSIGLAEWRKSDADEVMKQLTLRMQKGIKTSRRIMSWNLEPIDAPEHGESPKAVFGRFAFADEEDRLRPVKDRWWEQNTEIEADVLDQLNNHAYEDIPIKKSSADVLGTILKKGQYTDILHEPDRRFLYRGMTVPKSWVASLLKKNPDQVKPRGIVKVDFTFKPRGGSSSWTANKKVAKKFSKDNLGDVSIIIYASVNDNPNRFVAGPGGLYKLSAFSEFVGEKESMGLGDIKVCKIEWEVFRLQ